MKNIRYTIILLALIGCGDNSASVPINTTETPAFTLQDAYSLVGTTYIMQIEGLLDKDLGLVHFDKVIHHGSSACIVDLTISDSRDELEPNRYHLRIQDTSNSGSNPAECSDSYGIYWMTLTSNSEATLERI